MKKQLEQQLNSVEGTDKHSAARRKLLRGLIFTASGVTATKVLPEQWTKPVIDSIIVPAHAQTSPPVPEQEPDPFVQAGGARPGD